MRTLLATILTLCLTPLAFGEYTGPFIQAHFSRTTWLVIALAVVLIIINLRRRT